MNPGSSDEHSLVMNRVAFLACSGSSCTRYRTRTFVSIPVIAVPHAGESPSPFRQANLARYRRLPFARNRGNRHFLTQEDIPYSITLRLTALGFKRRTRLWASIFFSRHLWRRGFSPAQPPPPCAAALKTAAPSLSGT